MDQPNISTRLNLWDIPTLRRKFGPHHVIKTLSWHEQLSYWVIKYTSQDPPFKTSLWCKFVDGCSSLEQNLTQTLGDVFFPLHKHNRFFYVPWQDNPFIIVQTGTFLKLRAKKVTNKCLGRKREHKFPSASTKEQKGNMSVKVISKSNLQ